MDIIGKLITEWSWRCEKGYPDINNPSDMAELDILLEELGVDRDFKKISEEEEIEYPDRYQNILELIEQKKNNNKLMERIYRILHNSDYVRDIKDFLENKANIKRDTWDTTDLPNTIIRILQRGKRHDDVITFHNTIVKSSPKIESRRSGRVIDEYPSEIRGKIKKIGNIPGSKGRVTTGRGEILLALTFGDLKLSEGSHTGDLVYNNQYSVEVKATTVREDLAPSRRKGARIWADTKTDKYVPFNKKEVNAKGNLSDVVFQDFKVSLKNDEISKEENNVQLFMNYVQKYLENAYFGGRGMTINVKLSDFETTDSIENLFYEAIIRGYQSLKNMDYFLIFDPTNTNYKFYDVDEFIRDLQSGAVKTSNFSISSPIPQLMSFDV